MAEAKLSVLDTEVVIVGGGPVGMALALGLARRGVASVIFEADEGVCEGSRAICISRRSLEILDRLGVLAPFVETGLPWSSGRSFHEDTQVYRFEMPNDSDQRLPPMINIQQYYIETFLLEEVARQPLIQFHAQARVMGLRQDEDGVTVTAETPDGPITCNARYAAACDGARSTVRQQLGLKLAGTAYEGRYVIVDVEVEFDHPTERLAWFDPPSCPGRTVLMHRQPGNVWRIDYQMHDDEDASEMLREENLRGVVDAHFRMLGVGKPWRLIWSSSYNALALSLDEYVTGRVAFVGDAAHLVPIFGVRGLNSGFDDAYNLAWKLAASLRDEAPAALLETYSQERRHAWQVNISHAMKSTDFMSPPTRGKTVMRNAALRAARVDSKISSLINPRQSSVICYDASALNTLNDASAGAAVNVGAPLPECPLKSLTGERVYLTRAIFDDFTLMRYSEVGRGEGSLTLIGDAVEPVRLQDAEGRFSALFAASPGMAWLVRPDGHLCAIFHAPSEREIEKARLTAMAKCEKSGAAHV